MTTIATPLSAVRTILDLYLFNSFTACASALLRLDFGDRSLLEPCLPLTLSSSTSC